MVMESRPNLRLFGLALDLQLHKLLLWLAVVFLCRSICKVDIVL